MCAGKPGYPLTRDDLNMDPSATGSHAGHSSAASPAGDMEGAAASALHGGRREAVKAVIAVVGAVVAVGAAAI